MEVIVLLSAKEVKGFFPMNEWRIEAYNGEVRLRKSDGTITFVYRPTDNPAMFTDAVDSTMLPAGWMDPNRKWEYDVYTKTFTEVINTTASA